MARRIAGTTPAGDGYRMPAEYEPQDKVWMIWPERPDNWRDGAKPAQREFAGVARAISRFEPVTMLASPAQWANARAQLPAEVRVVEMATNDAWARDSGPTFLVDGKGGLRACDWTFNAWGGLVDGLYFPWDQDDLVARKICDLEGVDSYRTEGFVLEGGSFHVDGEGTVLTTESCLLSAGRNPGMDRGQIEDMLRSHLGCGKVLWLGEGIDPDETNGHIDDVACFTAPGEVAVIDTDDASSPFFAAAKDAQRRLASMTDARGRRLRVHTVPLPAEPVTIGGDFAIDAVEGTKPRRAGDVCIASYLNFLVVNGAVIVPQYGDRNDAVALERIGALFPGREAVGVPTREIVYGGGNVHCITQQQPRR